MARSVNNPRKYTLRKIRETRLRYGVPPFQSGPSWWDMSRDKVLSNWAVKTMLGLENFQIFNFYKGMIGNFPNSHPLEYLINTQRNTWVCEREEGRREKGGKGRGVRSFPGLPVNWGVKSSKTTGVTSTPPLPVPSTRTWPNFDKTYW
jgi:hypothetical protein